MNDHAEAELTTAEAIAALEAFVVDNDDLVQLEERIGRFNIFDALGIVRNEIRHSNFLAWLLDPGETHGTGQLFLRAVLMDILHRAPTDIRPLSPVEIDGLELAGVEVRREQDHIDILIAADDPKIVVAIENKIDSDEHSNQLNRYRETVARRYPDHRPLFVFLTREGDEASDEAWSPYSYADLHASLSRVRRLNDNAIGDDVLVFLDQYLRMIGSRFMDDPKIDELCDRIYRNHRQALDLIFQRKGDPRAVLISECVDEVNRLRDDIIIRGGNFSKSLAPRAWIGVVDGINEDARLRGKAQLHGTIVAYQRKLGMRLSYRPTPNGNPDVLEAVKASKGVIGFRKDPQISKSGRKTPIIGRAVLRNPEGLTDTPEDIDKAKEGVHMMLAWFDAISDSLGVK